MGSISAGPEVTNAFSRHLKGWSLEELVNAGEAIEGLIAHPGWSVLTDLLEAEREGLSGRVGNVIDPPSRAQYAAMHGRLGGLRAVREAAHTVIGKRDEKLAEQRERHEADEPLALAAERG